MKPRKIYIGPMTQNVIDSVIEFANETSIPLGFILSRRQIDENGGYVGYKTKDFIKYVRNKSLKDNVIVCRDHSGVGQGKITDCPMEYDLYSMKVDAINSIDVIHIDPWKKFQSYDQGLRETLNNIFYVNAINEDTLFEVGTEEAIRSFSSGEFFRFLKDLKYNLGHVFNNIEYAVIQSGTKLLGTKNVGSFDENRLKEMTDICKMFDISSKEHNGDYLSDAGIKFRFDNGLNAINIAPEFGVIETKILLENMNDKQFFEVYHICLEGRNWEKWLNYGFGFDYESRKKEIIEVCGHYHNKEIKEIVNMDDNIIKTVLKKKLQELTSL